MTLTNLHQTQRDAVLSERLTARQSGDVETPETAVQPTKPATRPSGQLGRYLPFVGAAVVLLAAFSIAMFVGGSGGDDGQVKEVSSLDAFLQPAETARLKYEVDGGTNSLRNGGVLVLSDDLQMEVSLSPYPPTVFDIDIDIRLTTTEGEIVDDATISTVWDMDVMPHGPFSTQFRNSGNGQYSASFDFSMFGAWAIDTHISHPTFDSPDDVSLVVYVWPE